VVNPPAFKKYQFWTGPQPSDADLDQWLAKAKEHPGSWWPDWHRWVSSHAKQQVPARVREPGWEQVMEPGKR